ncbi:hypothetical protein AB6A40_009377 [Gnathostoma spinigerum]|uniref:NAD-dependent protein deacylase n=1 Tax=Gnathostoma spinigerum TaxID=75299 RepID=A0ABD6ES74_9BILA
MSVSRFVPESIVPSKSILKKMSDVLMGVDRFVVLTGAGVSTESGIPDYRSAKVGQYARSGYKPVEFADFMSSERWRQRYWARNYVAWPRFSSAECNINHRTIAKWEQSDRFVWLITQNVDGLHLRAGSKLVTELHGSGHRVKCMSCGAIFPRTEVQQWIRDLNKDWLVTEIGEMAPDGDVPIPEKAVSSFQLPHCPNCGPGSILKTDVVFFGDIIPEADIFTCYDKIDESDGMIVLGSSLAVMSGYRFVQYAASRDMPIIIVNIGPTRADHLATVKIAAKCSDVICHI